jgi:hypothetical protein
MATSASMIRHSEGVAGGQSSAPGNNSGQSARPAPGSDGDIATRPGDAGGGGHSTHGATQQGAPLVAKRLHGVGQTAPASADALLQQAQNQLAAAAAALVAGDATTAATDVGNAVTLVGQARAAMATAPAPSGVTVSGGAAIGIAAGSALLGGVAGWMLKGSGVLKGKR